MAKITRIKSKDRGPEKVKNARVVARVSSGDRTTKASKKRISTSVKSSENMKASENKSGKKVQDKVLAKKKRAEKKEAKRVAREKRREERIERRKNEPKRKKVLLFLPRLIIAPFVALGRYMHASWIELRQVRWPSRKATWKMFFAILLYIGILMAFVMGLDALFTWLFNFVIGK